MTDSPDTVVRLIRLAQALRDERHELSNESLTCQNAATELQTLRQRVSELEGRPPLNRIATALEKAAIHGWGRVDPQTLESPE
jgi:hypothetical protein